MAVMLTKIKELIPAYTGWPRKKKSGVESRESGEGNEAKPRGIEAEPRKTKGELEGEGA